MLGTYECQVFLDWRFVSGAQWKIVFEALKGAGVESIQAKFDELFAVKKTEAEVKGKGKKKPAARKQAAKKPAAKSAVKKPVKSKRPARAGKKKIAEK
jgi:hypothetical protein